MLDYSNLFKSIQSFVRTTNVNSKVLTIGLSKDEVSKIKKIYYITFPYYLEQYLCQFGKKFMFYGKERHEYIFSEKSILSSLKIAEKYNIKRFLTALDIRNVKGLLPLYFDEMRTQMIFLDPKTENGRLYRVSELYLGKGNEVFEPEDIEIAPYLNFSENLRERLFLQIKHMFYPNRALTHINLSNITWAKFHFHYHSEQHENYNLGFARKDFIKALREKQGFDGKYSIHFNFRETSHYSSNGTRH